MTSYKLISALPTDSKELTKISVKAKEYWGYPSEWMKLWEKDLTVNPEYLEENFVFKLINNQKIVGFIAYEQNRDQLEITHLWIKPELIGKGLGKKLFEESIIEVAKEVEFKKVLVVADPNAEGFYRKMGFEKVGEVESLPEGRWLPLLEKVLVTDR